MFLLFYFPKQTNKSRVKVSFTVYIVYTYISEKKSEVKIEKKIYVNILGKNYFQWIKIPLFEYLQMLSILFMTQQCSEGKTVMMLCWSCYLLSTAASSRKKVCHVGPPALPSTWTLTRCFWILHSGCSFFSPSLFST